MKRRNFLKNTALIAAAGSFLPQLFAQGPSSIEIASIPKGLPQIRHGLLLAETGQQLLSSCSWLGKVDYQHFLRNGLEEGEEGMEHYSLELDKRPVQIAFEGDYIWLSSTEEIKKIGWNESLQAEGFNFQLVQSHAKELQIWAEDSIALNIKGKLKIEGQELKKGQLTYWRPISQLQIEENSSILIISKI